MVTKKKFISGGGLPELKHLLFYFYFFYFAPSPKRKRWKFEETFGKLCGGTNTSMRKCYISDNFPHFWITILAALLPCCQCFRRTGFPNLYHMLKHIFTQQGERKRPKRNIPTKDDITMPQCYNSHLSWFLLQYHINSSSTVSQSLLLYPSPSSGYCGSSPPSVRRTEMSRGKGDTTAWRRWCGPSPPSCPGGGPGLRGCLCCTSWRSLCSTGTPWVPKPQNSQRGEGQWVLC